MIQSEGHARSRRFSASIVAPMMLLAALIWPPPSFSQGAAGRILGAVTDQSGGAIVGATVVVTDVDRNVPRTMTTDEAGQFNAPNLLPGQYKVRAEAKGFKTFERLGILLEINGELRVDLQMQPGEVSQTIVVNESVPMVETTNAVLGATLQSTIIADIPLNGRNFVNLLQLNPGVTIYPGGTGGSQSANGQRPHDNVYMVNGIMASDPWMGQSIFNASEAAGDAGTIMPVDAIDEFKTEENPRAEYGWKPGAIVNVGVKSGTNALHGTAYAYGRDTVFDARNYFNPVNATNSTKQPVALEQFGATLGGPIKKDRLFYFVSYEGQRYSVGNPAAIKTPTQAALMASCSTAMTAGMLAPLSASLAGLNPATCLADPSKTTKDPGGLPFQGLFPVNDGSNGGNVFTDLLNNNVINGGLAKVDFHANEKNQLEGMYFISQGDNHAVDDPSAEVSPNWTTLEHARSQAASGDWVYTPKPSLVNEVRFGYAHYYQTFFGADASQSASAYDFNGQTYEIPTGITNPLYGGAPYIQIVGFYSGQPGIGANWPKINGPDAVLELLDHVSILHGRHAFKFGGEMIYNSADNNSTSRAKGAVAFTSLDNFFAGNVAQAALFSGDGARTFYNYEAAGFVQDDWRIRSRLTLNLGLRYEISTVVHERNGQMGNFDPILGVYHTNNPYNGDHNNFAPRVGFAWDVFGNGKTVLRGGAGILYEQFTFDVMNGQGNTLGLRSIPTGLPLFNDGSTTALPINGTIQVQALGLRGLSTVPISQAWQSFDPALPVSGQAALFASVVSPACGDNVTQPNPSAPPPPSCEIYGVNPNIRSPYVSTWNLGIERAITNNLSIDVGYVGNHGTKLLGKLDHNQPAPGAGWTPAVISSCIASPNPNTCSPDPAAEEAAEPFTAPCAAAIGIGANQPGGIFNPQNSCFSYLSYITLIDNSYESNYNGLQTTLTGRNYHGLSFTAGYTYSHTLGDAEDAGVAANFPVPLNSYGNLRQQLYGNTDFDIRHRFTLSLNYVLPGRKGFGQMLEGWSVNSVVLLTSGLPWGLADLTDDFSGTNVIASRAQSVGEQWNFFGNPNDFTPVHGFTDTNGGWLHGGGGLPFSGADSTGTIMTKCVNADNTHFSGQQLQLAQASLALLGCYAVGNSVLLPPPFGSYGNTKPDIWRDGGFRNWDFSVTKLFTFKERFKAETRLEIFNILNHPNFANPSAGVGGNIQDPSTQPFGFVAATPDTLASNPQLGSGGARAMQLGLKLSW